MVAILTSIWILLKIYFSQIPLEHPLTTHGATIQGCIGPSKLEDNIRNALSEIKMFDISLKSMFHNELVTLSLCSRNTTVIIKTKGRKRIPVVKALNGRLVLVGGKLIMKTKSGPFSISFLFFFSLPYICF